MRRRVYRILILVVHSNVGIHHSDMNLTESPQARKWLIKWRTYCYIVVDISLFLNCVSRELELHAMRMGPGKHLKGRTLMGGIVKPEEVGSHDFPIP